MVYEKDFHGIYKDRHRYPLHLRDLRHTKNVRLVARYLRHIDLGLVAKQHGVYLFAKLPALKVQKRSRFCKWEKARNFSLVIPACHKGHTTLKSADILVLAC